MMNRNTNVRAGDSLFLGLYPQDGRGEDYPIEWKVLAVEEERVLVLSRFVLDMQPFHTENVVMRWENSSLRSWLNGEFMEAAFDEEELEAICNPGPAEDPIGDVLWQMFGLETATSGVGDRVFLLSTSDVQQYFPSADGNSLFCSGASAQCTEFSEGDSEVCWWLRSSISSYPMAHIVSPVDSVGMSMIDGGNKQGVRPALWLHRSACRKLTGPSGRAYEPSRDSTEEEDARYEDLESEFLRREVQVNGKKAGVPLRKLRPVPKTGRRRRICRGSFRSGHMPEVIWKPL